MLQSPSLGSFSKEVILQLEIYINQCALAETKIVYSNLLIQFNPCLS